MKFQKTEEQLKAARAEKKAAAKRRKSDIAETKSDIRKYLKGGKDQWTK